MATKSGILNHIIELAYIQALWQFISTLAVTKINNSTYQAKENAVMTLVYINVIRITLGLILEHNQGELLSLDFMNKMAEIKDRMLIKKLKSFEFIIKVQKHPF